MRIVCPKAENLIGGVERNHLLAGNRPNLLPGLAVMQRQGHRFRPMVDVDVSGTVRHRDEAEVRGARAELALLLGRLDVAESVEGAHVLPDDNRGRRIPAGNFRLPEKAVDVMAEAHRWRFASRQECVEQPLVTARICLQS